jgi:hypothetical protein
VQHVINMDLVNHVIIDLDPRAAVRRLNGA